MAGRTFQAIQAIGARVALVASLLMSGCWLQVGLDAGHTRFNWTENGLTRDNVDTLVIDWEAGVPGLYLSEPIVSGGRVFLTYTTAEEARVRAFDLATGATLWDQLLVQAPFSGPRPPGPIGGAPVAFVGDELWTGHFFVELGGARRCAYVSDILDPATGARLGGSEGFPSAAVSWGPIVARNVTNAGSTGCTGPESHVLEVSRRQPDGSVTSWRSATAVDVARTEGPTLAGDEVVIALGAPTTGFSDTVHGFAVDGCGTPTCMPVWTVTLDAPVSFVMPVAGAAGPIFVLSGQNLVALDRGSGAELWRAPLGGLGAELALANGTVYATTARGHSQLLAFDAEGCDAPSCDPLWTASLGGETGTSPTVGGGVVWVASDSLRAFDAAGCGADTCAPLASRGFGVSFGQVSLAQGRVFVTSVRGLAALAPSE
jgi:outer membrane protein assembly factor BamB